jgi:hypothetical protein
MSAADCERQLRSGGATCVSDVIGQQFWNAYLGEMFARKEANIETGSMRKLRVAKEKMNLEQATDGPGNRSPRQGLWIEGLMLWARDVTMYPRWIVAGKALMKIFSNCFPSPRTPDMESVSDQ